LINNINSIIFDLDGTIADTSGDIKDSLKKTFVQLGFFSDEVEKKIESACIGPPLKEMINDFNLDYDDSVIDKIIIIFRKMYIESGFPKTVLYDGIQSILDLFFTLKKQVFIATNKPSIPTIKILDKLNIIEKFTGIICVDTYKTKLSKNEMLRDLIIRWDLDQNKTIMIGDSASDIIAAKKNGLSSIGILSGYGNAKDIIMQRPHFYINNHVELFNIIHCLIKGVENA